MITERDAEVIRAIFREEVTALLAEIRQRLLAGMPTTPAGPPRKCTLCSGTGMVQSAVCQGCHGTGEVRG